MIDADKLRQTIRDAKAIVSSKDAKITVSPNGLAIETREGRVEFRRRMGPLGVLERYGVTYTKRD